MSDCEIPQFYQCTEPTANREHKCCEFSAPILPGEKYLRVGMKYEGQCMTEKQHLACAEACEYVRDNINDECLMYGELMEWWNEDGHWASKKDEKGRRIRSLMANIILRQHRKGA